MNLRLDKARLARHGRICHKPARGTTGKNVIMVLNEIAMSQGVCMDWTMVDEDGPPHMRAFTWTLKMGSYEAVGSGNSKKLAKAIAAQNMYQVI